jgi:hypothetical protein
VQFVAIDTAKAQEVWTSPLDKVARVLPDALARTRTQRPAPRREQFEGQLVVPLERLERSKSILDQLERAPRVGELLGHLFGAVAATGSAPEELWTDVVLPLLYAGTPEKFPPLDDEELEAIKQGADPLLLFLDVVPYQTPAPEEGLMGAFSPDELELPHERFARTGSLRIVRLKGDRLAPLVEKFDAQKTRDTLERFAAYAQEKAAAPMRKTQEGDQMLKVALTLLEDLKRAFGQRSPGKVELHLRRVTEAEAAAEEGMDILRKALTGPRLILV